MKTLTILVRRAAARWAQKHRAACQAQPEQHIPAGEAVQKTADKPTSEERKAEKAAETSEQVHNRQAVSNIVDMERRLILADRYRFRYNLLTGMTEFLERNALPESGKSLFKDKETIPENKERNPKDRETNSGVARMFAFHPLTARAFNTICLAAHEADIPRGGYRLLGPRPAAACGVRQRGGIPSFQGLLCCPASMGRAGPYHGSGPPGLRLAALD